MQQAKLSEEEEVSKGSRNEANQEWEQQTRQQALLRVVPDPVQVSPKTTEKRKGSDDGN